MKKIKFFAAIITYLLLALADGGLTYYNTPDLSMEGNPLVAELGLGWGALAIANILTFVGFTLILYYYFFKYETVYTDETKLTRYWSQVVYGRPDKFWTGLIPKRFGPFVAMLAFATIPAFIISRAIVVAEWICYTLDVDQSKYWAFERKFLFGNIHITVATVITIIAIIVFMYKEFKKQLPKVN